MHAPQKEWVVGWLVVVIVADAVVVVGGWWIGYNIWLHSESIAYEKKQRQNENICDI